jgi:pimeloyl-ACP methyl ester carboxylesterase
MPTPPAPWSTEVDGRRAIGYVDVLSDATYVELRASHFVQMEHPETVHRLLLELLARDS